MQVTVSLTPTAVLLLLPLFTVLHGHKWTYNGPEGEQHWSKHYPFCGGAFQSPIDIKTELLRFDPSLRAVEPHNYNLSAYEELTLGNNGHSLQLSLPSRMFISGLPHRYSAAQLHFHWGSSSRPAGSEHTIKGHQFAAEMHIVHYNSDKYPNISMAVDKSDGLAVLGVLVELGEFNPAFEKFLRFINGIKYRDQRVKVSGFNIRALLPSRLDEFYRYDGSLTTPPCYPSVLWTVFKNHVTISHRQFMSLATAMYSSHAQDSAPVPLNGNFRKPQQVTDNRLVLVSFKDRRGGPYGGPPVLTVTSPMLRRRIIQQLLVGDLADLADEGSLYRLLPQDGPPNPNPNQLPNNPPMVATGGNPWKYGLGYGYVPKPKKQQWLKKKTTGSYRNNRYGAGLMPMEGEAICFVSEEQDVWRQLRMMGSVRDSDLVVQALRDALFPVLNLRSYLACRSDLSLDTVRLILADRPTDEAAELERSLTRMMMTRTSSRGFPQGVLQPNGLVPNPGSRFLGQLGLIPPPPPPPPLPPLLPQLNKYEPLSPLVKNQGFHPGALPGKKTQQGGGAPAAPFTWILPMEVED